MRIEYLEGILQPVCAEHWGDAVAKVKRQHKGGGLGAGRLQTKQAGRSVMLKVAPEAGLSVQGPSCSLCASPHPKGLVMGPLLPWAGSRERFSFVSACDIPVVGLWRSPRHPPRANLSTDSTSLGHQSMEEVACLQGEAGHGSKLPFCLFIIT